MDPTLESIERQDATATADQVAAWFERRGGAP
jgi:hypothetical protein